MSVREFVDINILVYTLDPTAGAKRTRRATRKPAMPSADAARQVEKLGQV
jgi:hypothetical protein